MAITAFKPGARSRSGRWDDENATTSQAEQCTVARKKLRTPVSRTVSGATDGSENTTSTAAYSAAENAIKVKTRARCQPGARAMTTNIPPMQNSKSDAAKEMKVAMFTRSRGRQACHTSPPRSSGSLRPTRSAVSQLQRVIQLRVAGSR